MSKYKYTSLLSSQYRQVFKSYHSVDRYENQSSKYQWKTCQNLSIQARNYSIKNKKTPMMRQNCQTISTPQNKYKVGIQFKSKSYHNSQIQSKDFHYNPEQNYQKNTIDNERLLNRIRNKYERLLTQKTFEKENINSKARSFNTYTYQTNSEAKINQNQNLKTISNFQYEDQIPCKRPYIDFNTISQKNNELKMKVSSINKKRSDIKLKMRVNDIDLINKKYNYLETQNQDIYRKKKVKDQSLNEIYEKSMTIHALRQKNLNQIYLNNQKNSCQNFRQKKFHQKFMKQKEEENIKTPHFYEIQNNQNQLDATLIERKLQRFTNNTYSDMY